LKDAELEMREWVH